MDRKELILLVIILINFIISIFYLIWGVAIRPRSGKTGEPRGIAKVVIISFVMILCPIIGTLFFLLGHVFFRIYFNQQADLSDIIFSKERKAASEREDNEGKLNFVPMEEALVISDKTSLRNLMMDVIKGDVGQSLAAISLALNSRDSETSHYAASVLRDELNDFRENVQKLRMQIKKEDENQSEYCCMLLNYMNGILQQKVFVKMEQEHYVQIMVETGEILSQVDKISMTSTFYEWICIRLIDLQKYELAEEWCSKSFEAYPMELSTYTCRLKLYFNMQDKKKFFDTMNDLKRSNIVIDNETLELIRIFQ